MMKNSLINIICWLAASQVFTNREYIGSPTLSSKILALKQSFINLIANASKDYHQTDRKLKIMVADV
jgi:hypothetical protein